MNTDLPAGFRLDYVEAYNWGTIRSEVQQAVLGGQNGVAFGKNGAGKTTVADIFVALFTAPHLRHYNRAGGSAKGERTDETYVRGAWGTEHHEQLGTFPLRYLRSKDTYSVILASFSDARGGRTLTLAQVIWFQKGEPKHLYCIATKPLSITTHFQVREGIPEFRKKLKRQNIEVYAEFSPYLQRVASLIGVRSIKAFYLFGQTMGIKDIGGLSDFIRNKMLEKPNSLEKLEQIQEQFDHLSRVHAEMILAEKQLAILTPLVEDASYYARDTEQQSYYERCLHTVPYIIAHRHRICIAETLASDLPLQEETARDIALLEQQEGTIRDEIAQLQIALTSDPTQQRIQHLREQCTLLQPQIERKQRQARLYTELAQKLDLPYDVTGTAFEQARNMAVARQQELQERINALSGGDARQAIEERQHRDIVSQLEMEIRSLQARQNQLPEKDVRFRVQLCTDLQIPVEATAFWGELVCVIPEAQAWEPAIERCLLPLGRSLIVPEYYYAQVCAYIEQAALEEHYRYHIMRVPANSESHQRTQTQDDTKVYLYQKLAVKPDTIFTQRLRDTLPDLCDYVCCQSLEQFQHEHRAITQQGHIKHTDARHEKNGTLTLGRKQDYILGWSNTDKIIALQKDLTNKQEILLTIRRQRDISRKELKQAQGEKEDLHLFLNQAFDLIDWETDQMHIEGWQEEIQQLVQAATSLHTTQVALAERKEHEQHIRTQLLSCTMTYKAVTQRIAQLQAEDDRLSLFVKQWEGSRDEQVVADIQTHLEGETLDLVSIPLVQERLMSWYREMCHALEKDRSGTAVKIEQAMNTFKQLSPGMVQHLDSSLQALEGYQQLYELIRNERLPECRSRFEKLLKEHVAGSMGLFNAILKQQSTTIQEEIQRLNTILKTAAYTDHSYIQLGLGATSDTDIRQFQSALLACFPDLYPDDSTQRLENSFQAIQALLQRLNEDTRWKMRVTDVRNWFDFWGDEYDTATQVVKNTYSDAAGISGGQKSKLTLTLQVTALAYQYNIHMDEPLHRSFRFTLVDEAFAQLDDQNIRHALALFQTFAIQFLVVTPSTKIHIIESFIQRCWWLRSNQDNNDTTISCMSIVEIKDMIQRKHAGEHHDHTTTDLSPS